MKLLFINLIHKVFRFYCSFSYRQYIKYADQVDIIQEQNRIRVLNYLDKPSCSYEEFKHFPISNYSDYEKSIHEQFYNKTKIICPITGTSYVPTSGSTSKVKLIPYTRMFRNEIDNAACVWIYNMFSNFPKTNRGHHYWSMSWIPDSKRKELATTDDSKVLSKVTSKILEKLMAVPTSVTHLDTFDQSFEMTIIHLIENKNLSVLSVWSPTFLLSIVHYIDLHYEYLASKVRPDLEARDVLISWKQNGIAENLNLIWPKLKLISCWKNYGATVFIQELKTYFPQQYFQGKGLWATEGVVTIPLILDNSEQYYLAYLSHFYEFKKIDSEEILRAHQLVVGERYIVLLTTSSGFIRYSLNDIVECSGYYKKIPQLNFIGRQNTIDMTGEKIDVSVVMDLFDQIESQFKVRPVSLLAYPFETPHYQLLFKDKIDESDVRKEAEAFLRSFLHYELAQSAGQLGPLEVRSELDIQSYYLKLTMPTNMVQGNKKIEILDRAVNKKSTN